jgi:hypothetical protein
MNLSSVFVRMSVPEFVCGATCVFVFAPIWMIICIDMGRIVRVCWKKEFFFFSRFKPEKRLNPWGPCCSRMSRMAGLCVGSIIRKKGLRVNMDCSAKLGYPTGYPLFNT